MHPIHRTAALFVAACLLPLIAACASSSGDNVGSTTKTAGSVTLRDYTHGTKLTLVSESMLVQQGIEGDTFEERELNFYSAEQRDATAKVCHDDAMTGLAQEFEKSPLAGVANAGPAPLTGNAKDNSIEIVIDGTTRHVIKDTSGETLAFVTYMQLFVEVYNVYEGRSNVGGKIQFNRPTFGGNMGGNR